MTMLGVDMGRMSSMKYLAFAYSVDTPYPKTYDDLACES